MHNPGSLLIHFLVQNNSTLDEKATVQDEGEAKRENVSHLRKITFLQFIYGLIYIP